MQGAIPAEACLVFCEGILQKLALDDFIGLVLTNYSYVGVHGLLTQPTSTLSFWER